MTNSRGDFALTLEELRVVARYATECAQEALAIFEADRPDDVRPRAAVEAAWAFVHGAPRMRLQRVTSLEAPRAAKDATTPAAQVIEPARRRATPTLVDVLRRYPPAPEGKNRVDRLWKALDTALRTE